jgi:hypothetical protein
MSGVESEKRESACVFVVLTRVGLPQASKPTFATQFGQPITPTFQLPSSWQTPFTFGKSAPVVKSQETDDDDSQVGHEPDDEPSTTDNKRTGEEHENTVFTVSHLRTCYVTCEYLLCECRRIVLVTHNQRSTASMRIFVGRSCQVVSPVYCHLEKERHRDASQAILRTWIRRNSCQHRSSMLYSGAYWYVES